MYKAVCDHVAGYCWQELGFVQEINYLKIIWSLNLLKPILMTTIIDMNRITFSCLILCWHVLWIYAMCNWYFYGIKLRTFKNFLLRWIPNWYSLQENQVTSLFRTNENKLLGGIFLFFNTMKFWKEQILVDFLKLPCCGGGGPVLHTYFFQEKERFFSAL